MQQLELRKTLHLAESACREYGMQQWTQKNQHKIALHYPCQEENAAWKECDFCQTFVPWRKPSLLSNWPTRQFESLHIWQKLPPELTDRRRVTRLISIRESAMFGKFKKNIVPLKTRLFNIQWYPNNRSCANHRKTKTQQMPPLMVRKAEWRR